MSYVASATGNNHEDEDGNGDEGGVVYVTNEGGESASNSEATSSSDSASTSDSASEASAGASATNNLTVSSTHPSSQTIRNVASPDTPNVYPSAPCRVAHSAGLSFAGGALSGGSSTEDPECTLRETARAFQYLGVPAVGLVLLCQNSVVITGRKDKNGELEKNESPMGTDECLRLVRDFQGTADDDVAHAQATEQRLRDEMQAYRAEQHATEQSLYARIDELEQMAAKPVPRARVVQTPAPVIVQQPYLSEEKKAQLRALTTQETEE